MDGSHAFLESIAASPADDTPRLVYADWLDEAGDDLAAFVRADCALAAMPEGDPARGEASARRDALLRAGEGAWLAPLRGVPGLEVRWERGLATCEAPVGAFLDHHAALTHCRAASSVAAVGCFGDDLCLLSPELWDGVRPLPRLAGLGVLFFDSWDDFGPVRASPFARRLSRLDLSGYFPVGPGDVRAAVDLVCAAELPRATVDAGPGHRWPAVVSRTARQPGGAVELDLSGDPGLCRRGDLVVGLAAALGRRPAFAGVRTLRLRNLGLDPGPTYRLLDALADSPAFGRLTHLDLGGLPRERDRPDSPLAVHADAPTDGGPNVFPDHIGAGEDGGMGPGTRAFCGRLRRVSVGIDYDWHGPENEAFLRRLFPAAEVFVDDVYPMADGRTRRLGE